MLTHSSISSRIARVLLKEKVTVKKKTISKTSLMRFNRPWKISTIFSSQMLLSTTSDSTRTSICSAWTVKETRVRAMAQALTKMKSQHQRREAKRAAKEEMLLKLAQMDKSASNNE